MSKVRSATGQLLRSVALRYQHRHAGGWLVHRHVAITGRCLAKAADANISVGGEFARDERLARLEAVLFLSQQPQSSRKLAQLAGLADGTKARTLVRTLNRLYDAEGSAFRVEELAGGFQLLTRSKFAPWLRRLHTAPVEVRLSAPALETLAVVAYRQPVLRAEIEAIRGVQSGEVLRQLIERDLVRIVGRSNELGRPFLYGTTRQFLQTFGLRHLDELPKQPNHSQVVEEEKNVKTLINPKAEREFLADDRIAVAMAPELGDRPGNEAPFAKYEDDKDDDFDDEDDDLDDEDEDDDEDDDDDDDLEDEPWEEVEDDDEDLDDDEDEEDDWDEDEDWDDEDWDDDEDDWDDEDEEDEEDEEEPKE